MRHRNFIQGPGTFPGTGIFYHHRTLLYFSLTLSCVGHSSCTDVLLALFGVIFISLARLVERLYPLICLHSFTLHAPRRRRRSYSQKFYLAASDMLATCGRCCVEEAGRSCQSASLVRKVSRWSPDHLFLVRRPTIGASILQ